jgi:hypothetical protein
MCCDTSKSRCLRQRLRMIAGRVSDDTATSGLLIEEQHRIARAAKLE